jgi:hypothetical protein
MLAHDAEMNFIQKQYSKITAIKKPYFFFILAIAFFFSLSLFYRFLQFNRVTKSDRIAITFCFFSFFALFLLELLPQVIEHLLLNKYRFFIIGGTVVLVGVLFLLLPYKFAPFRTVHSLQIYVPMTSSPVTIDKITNDDGHLLNLANGDTIQKSEPRVILPGETVGFLDTITGGLKLKLTAEKPSAILQVSWDGTSSIYEIKRPQPLTYSIRTDPQSWGKPDGKHIFLAILNCVSDGISVAFFLIILTQLVFDLILHQLPTQQNQPDYFINTHQTILLLELPIGLLVAISLIYPRKLPLYSEALLFLVLLWGINILRVYPMKTIIRGVPLILSATVIFVALLYFPEGFSFIGWLVSVSIILLWAVYYLRKKLNTSGFQVFVGVVAILSILINILSFPINQQHGTSRMHILNSGTTYESVVNTLCPAASTGLSVAYYKQLDGASIVLTEHILSQFFLDKDRLINLNRLANVTVKNYIEFLSDNEYKALVSNDDIIPWQNCRLGGNAMYYLMNDPENSQKTYVFYEYKSQAHDDLFILPENYLK